MINIDEIINILDSDEYYKVKNNIDELISNEQFIDRIIKIDNPFIFDRFIKMCEYKIDTSYIYEIRNKFIEAILTTFNPKFDIKDRWITEYIIGYYFGDNYYNFMSNFYQMLNYIQYTKKIIISDKNIKIYNKFKNLNYMTISEKLELFKEYHNINIMEMFYDDMNTIKTDSYQTLVESSLKLNHESPIYKKELSKRFGIDIYYLVGEEFYGFIRCLIIKRNDLTDQYNYVLSKKGRLGYSFSYIGDKNIGTSDYDGKSVILFYDDINYRNIMYVHHVDLHAKSMHKQNDYLSEKINEIMTPDGLVTHTKNYNEVYIKAGEEGIKPKALICYDEITKDDLTFAKKYDLSILLIKREKYKRYETFDEDYLENTYVI